jgi:aspartate/glutamate racemase
MSERVSDALTRHPKIKLTPPGPPMMPNNTDDMKAWVDGVIAVIMKQTVGGKNLVANNDAWAIHLVFDKFPPEYLEYYHKLQHEIAGIITQEEANRPTITLRIRGSERQDAPPFYGYVGGMGPLSDASTILKVRETYDQNEGPGSANKYMSVDLLSCPPYRGEQNSYDRKSRYIFRVAKFADDCGAPDVAMLSNTAHIHLNKIKAGMYARRTPKIYKWLSRGSGKIRNLIAKVADNIKYGDKLPNGSRPYQYGDDVLIFGTKDARESMLYNQALWPNHFVSSHYPMKDQDGTILQYFIDNIKQDNLNAIDATTQLTTGESLVNYMVDNSNIRQETSHILLACTELSLCFHTPLPPSVKQKYPDLTTYQDLFKYKYKEAFPNRADPIIVDTEIIFAQATVKQQLESEAIYNRQNNIQKQMQQNSVGHGLVCSHQPMLMNPQDPNAPLPFTPPPWTQSVPANRIPVPRKFYEAEQTFSHINEFAEQHLIQFDTQVRMVFVDFDAQAQTDAVRAEMAVAGLIAGLKLGVQEPIEITGDDMVAVKASAEYCKNHGYGFYVVGPIQHQLPMDLQAAHSSRQPEDPTVAAQNANHNIADLISTHQQKVGQQAAPPQRSGPSNPGW